VSDSIGAFDLSSQTFFLRSSLEQPRKVVRGPLPVICHFPESAIVSPSSGGHLVRVCSKATVYPKWGDDMHREDLMKPDLVSEIVLLGSASLLFVSVLVIVLTALSRA